MKMFRFHFHFRYSTDKNLLRNSNDFCKFSQNAEIKNTENRTAAANSLPKADSGKWSCFSRFVKNFAATHGSGHFGIFENL